MPAPRRSYAYRELGVDLATIQATAAASLATVRSVITELRHQALGEGQPVRGAVGHRIRAELAVRGLPPPPAEARSA
jgi:hypothetical protein